MVASSESNLSSALTDLLARVDAALDAAEPREVAALSREKRQILAAIDAAGGTMKGSPIDELNDRREARRAASAARASAGGGRQQRGKRGG